MNRIELLRDQLANVYAQMHITGSDETQQVTLGEDAFLHLNYLAELLPEERATELIVRLSDDQPSLRVAELFNILIWSADGSGKVDTEEIQSWFYGKQRRRIEIASQVDLFPSNSMDESERVVGELRKRYPELDHLLAPLLGEVLHRAREERAWAEYRRETFEMPKEMTPSILHIIKDIKRKQ